jgi:cysteine desulfuration protein SufE
MTSRLAEIVDEFAEAEPRERLEILRDYADSAPALPERLLAIRDAGANRVHECMTPVFLWVEVTDGRVHIYSEVAPEGPTVRGFLALLTDALDGATPAEVLDTPQDLIARLKLVEVLGMNRMRGLHAILHRIRMAVSETAKRADTPVT